MSRYQVGKPNELTASDPWFETLEAALEHASQLHMGDKATHPFGYDPVGIWDERSRWVCLFFDGEQFNAV